MSGLRNWAAVGVLSLASFAGQLIVVDAKSGVTAESTSSCELPIVATTAVRGESHHSLAETVPFDLQFIDRTTVLQVGAITMASVALQHAQDSQVRRIALRIAESRAGEIQQLRYWRDTWYPGAERALGPHVGPNSHASFEMNVEMAIAVLCSAQSNFDRTFLELMLDHNQITIDVAEDGRINAEHLEIVAFAESIIAAQSDESAMMSRWLAELDATPNSSS